ncbi:hypothetical protein EDB83DRAFT_2194289, partial [Lactarius deliciosus]
MAQLARDFHDNLQTKDISLEDDDPVYTGKVADSLREVPESQRLSDDDILQTDWSPSYAQVGRALRLAKNGTATGLDGCPYELWKELNTLYDIAEKEEKIGFDVIGALTKVFTDIQYHGVDERTEFA